MNISITRLTATTLMILILLCWASGCASLQPMPTKGHKPTISAKPQPKVPPAKHVLPSSPKPEFLEHTVRWRNETLSHIALWYTGKTRNWKKIASANPSLKGHKIFIGTIILIPKDLVITRKQMPREFATAPSSTQVKSNKNPLEAPQQKEPDGINLFEPVDSAEKTNEQPPNGRADNIELFEPVQGN